jgi:hypothetical protein
VRRSDARKGRLDASPKAVDVNARDETWLETRHAAQVRERRPG